MTIERALRFFSFSLSIISLLSTDCQINVFAQLFFPSLCHIFHIGHLNNLCTRKIVRTKEKKSYNFFVLKKTLSKLKRVLTFGLKRAFKNVSLQDDEGKLVDNVW